MTVYEKRLLPNLKKLARDRGYIGYSRLNKKDLIRMLRSGTKKATKKVCKDKLNEKIRKNMNEYKKGKIKSRRQALAISYSQVKRKIPQCTTYFKR